MRRFPVFFALGLLTLLFVLLSGGAAFAQDGASTDLSIGWLDALFRGVAVSDAGVPVFLAPPLARILHLYSTGLLALAGLVVLYTVVTSLAQTAQTGQISLGGSLRAMMPMRLVLAIALLVPTGQGLNVAQNLVVRIASGGAGLATKAWETAAEPLQKALAGTVAPRGPDMKATVARATEMAVCRSVYRALVQSTRTDDLARLMGDMADFERKAQTRLDEEAWRYTNVLHDAAPLCGGYRFAFPIVAIGAGKREGDAADLASLSETAHLMAERLALQANAIGARVAPHFAAGGTALALQDSGSLAAIVREQQETLDAQLTLLARDRAKADRLSAASLTGRGWIGAGSILLETMNRQAQLGALADRAVPLLDPPLPGHKILDHAAQLVALENSRIFRAENAAQRESLFSIYDRLGLAMRQAREWIYGSQLSDANLALASTYDIQDSLYGSGDADRAFPLFRRVLDQGFASFGVWGYLPHDAAARQASGLLERERMERPVAALAEIGRRMNAMGLWALGVLGGGLGSSATVLPALFYAFLAGSLAVGGLGLLFLLPFIPLFRFMVGVLVWFLAVCEAVVAAPLIALAHLNPAGAGLVSPSARRAYLLLLGVFLRPFLTVFGFLAGWACFYLGLLLVNALFATVTTATMAAQPDSLTGLRVVGALLFVACVLLISNVSFRAISFFPSKALRWLDARSFDVLPETLPSAVRVSVAGSDGSASVSAAASSAPHGARSSSRHSSDKRSVPTSVLAQGRESAQFPQVREKDIPEKPIPGSAEAHAAADARQAAALATTGEKGQAIAIAKAAVIMGADNKLEKGLREAEQLIQDLGNSGKVEKKDPGTKDDDKETPTEVTDQEIK